MVVVIGGGLLGMDMAETFRNIGLEVKFLVRRDVLGAPFFDEHGCALIHEEFKDMGVHIMTHTEAQSLEGNNTHKFNV